MPSQLIIDNGKEFMSKEFENWCTVNKVEIHRTSPGKHQSNGRVEHFNRNLWQIVRKEYSSDPNFDLEKKT